MEAYWTTSAQLGVETDRWRAALYADNLFDVRAQLFRLPIGGPGGHFDQTTNRPRTVGFSLKYSFR